MSISLEDLRKVLGLDSVKDTDGNVIKEPPLPIWANFRQRALDVAILEINNKTDLRIKLSSLERSKHRRVVALTSANQNTGRTETPPGAMKRDSATPASVPGSVSPCFGKGSTQSERHIREPYSLRSVWRGLFALTPCDRVVQTIRLTG